MPAASARPHAVLLLATAAALLLAASAISPAAAGGVGGGGGRMVTIRIAPPVMTTSAAAGARSNRWQRRLEDEVAPELGAVLATSGNFVSSRALIANNAACIRNCAGRGQSYTRPCGNRYQSQGC